jgi:hypothetical protein
MTKISEFLKTCICCFRSSTPIEDIDLPPQLVLSLPKVDSSTQLNSSRLTPVPDRSATPGAVVDFEDLFLDIVEPRP